MPERIDLPTARVLLRQAMETQGPDFVYGDGSGYQVCNYGPTPDVSDNRSLTGCLVGVALALHGFTDHQGRNESVEGLYHQMPWLMDKAASVYFQRAQTEQDNGSTWGEALESAERVGGQV